MAHDAGLRFRFEADAGEFEVVRFELKEGVSQPFRLELALSSLDDAIQATSLLDCEVRFTIERNGAADREVVGIVTAFEQGGTGFRRTRYRAMVESPLARLTLRHGSRIFQQVNATEVLATVLKDGGVPGVRTAYFAPHEPREYCVQYRETDASFFDRLAIEDGIVYWHEVEAGRAALVLSDKIGHAPVLSGHAPVIYQAALAADGSGQCLSRFAYRRQLAPTRVTQREYAFHEPRYPLQHEAKAWAVEDAVGNYEHYDHAARYKADAAGQSFARNRLSGLRNAADMAVVAGDDARLFPGLSFDLTGHPSEFLNDHWRVVWMHHQGEQGSSHGADGAGHRTRYGYEASVVPAHYDWKPQPASRPVVDGPQIAHVVGPDGEETHCDVHGRVQVRFPWDRQESQEGASCWVPVWQGWAGVMHGFQALPRIGQQVIVSFLEGDPDQPIVTGCPCDARQRLHELNQEKAAT